MCKKLFVLGSMTLLFGLALRAADITGKWVAQVAGRNGSQEVTFNLKADGDKITGTVLGGGGGGGGRKGGAGAGGGAPQPQQISDGKITGDQVSFTVKVDNNGQAQVTTYKGTFSGDELKLKREREGRNGLQSTDIAAKRSGS